MDKFLWFSMKFMSGAVEIGIKKLVDDYRLTDEGMLPRNNEWLGWETERMKLVNILPEHTFLCPSRLSNKQQINCQT